MLHMCPVSYRGISWSAEKFDHSCITTLAAAASLSQILPTMKHPPSFNRLFVAHFEEYSRLSADPHAIILDGHRLSLAEVIAVARYA